MNLLKHTSIPILNMVRSSCSPLFLRISCSTHYSTPIRHNYHTTMLRWRGSASIVMEYIPTRPIIGAPFLSTATQGLILMMLAAHRHFLITRARPVGFRLAFPALAAGSFPTQRLKQFGLRVYPCGQEAPWTLNISCFLPNSMLCIVIHREKGPWGPIRLDIRFRCDEVHIP